jgi:hypothetical protein
MFPNSAETLQLLNFEQLLTATAYSLLLDHYFFFKLT